MKMRGGFRALPLASSPDGLVPGGRGGIYLPEPLAKPAPLVQSARPRPFLSLPARLPRMSTSVPQGHNWARKVKEEADDEDPLDQLISRSGCAASHFALQECMAQHQDWRQCQPQVQAFRDCMSEQQAKRREELQKRKEQASAHC